MHDAQELTELIKDTPNMIARHRVHAEKGGVGYSDTPTVGGFEPSLPMAYDFMDAADMEAAWLGNVMKHCVNMGAIPPLKFQPFHDRKQDHTDRLHGTWWGRGFWWVNGRCKGLAGGQSEEPTYGFFGKVSNGWRGDIDAIAQHLQTWAPTVLRVEGVDPFIEDGERIRTFSQRCFPAEVDEWLTIEVAARRFDRSPNTVLQWVKTGTIEHIGKGGDALIKESSMKFRIDAIKSNLAITAENARKHAGQSRL